MLHSKKGMVVNIMKRCGEHGLRYPLGDGKSKTSQTSLYYGCYVGLSTASIDAADNDVLWGISNHHHHQSITTRKRRSISAAAAATTTAGPDAIYCIRIRNSTRAHQRFLLPQLSLDCTDGPRIPAIPTKNITF